jgi:hypothetical protein
MANFTELDSNNKVIRTLEVDDKHCGGPDNTDDDIGQNFLRKVHLDSTAIWKRTSNDFSFRGRLAGHNCIYDSVKDKFIPSQIYPSWSLNETTLLWDPPSPQPTDKPANWDEDSQSWLTEMDPDTGEWLPSGE